MDIDDLIEQSTVVNNIPKERKICINAIISEEFVKKLKPLLTDLKLIESTFVRTILRWAFAYYEKYSQAMDKNIIAIYEQEREKLNETASKDIADFLGSISEEYASAGKLHNVLLEVDIAEKYIKGQQIKQHQKKLDKCMLTNDVDKAEHEIATYKRVSQVGSESIDATEDYGIYTAERQTADILFTPPGRFGDLMGPFRRKKLVAVTGGAKSSKSRTMVKMAAWAYINGFSVFYASLEIDYIDIRTLIDSEILHLRQEAGTAKIPVFVPAEEGTWTVKHNGITLTGNSPERMEQEWKAHKRFNTTGQIYIHCWSQLEANVQNHFDPELDLLYAEKGLSFDMFICDDADNMSCSPGDEKKDLRFKIMNSWKDLKAFGQRRNMCVITASQTDENMKMRETYSKATDVDLAIGIQNTPEEQERGISRFYCTIHRAMPFNKDKALVVLSNHGIGRALIDYRWEHETQDIINDIPDDFKLFKKGEDAYADYTDLYDYL